MIEKHGEVFILAKYELEDESEARPVRVPPEEEEKELDTEEMGEEAYLTD